MKTEDFNYYLPADLIAQNPVYPRDSSRLMVLNREKQSISHHVFNELPSLLGSDVVLIFNKSKVIPARIHFKINHKDSEILLIRRLMNNVWLAMVRPGKFFKKNDKINLRDGVKCSIIDVDDNGFRVLKFSVGGEELMKFIYSNGVTPLPPYIKNSKALLEDYQTVYAETEGSVAAPTAGLHFTADLNQELVKSGAKLEYLTLHVGPGTFLPVKTANIKDHKMHSEFYEINQKTADSLNHSYDLGKRLIAVGTTSVRVLESTFENGFKNDQGDTDIFIYPGYQWKCVQGLLTNFHLPKSTLLMLVSSFAGHEFIMKAYKVAVKEKYRFFSFGDSMLIL